MEREFFLGIGAQRSGTTWLAEYCRAHPQIGITFPKEVHYFDVVHCPKMCPVSNRRERDELERIRQKAPGERSEVDEQLLFYFEQRARMFEDERYYVEFVESFAEPSHRVLGEITPSYSLLPASGFRAIRTLIPQCRFVFVMRDPVERFWSHVRWAQEKQEEHADASERIASYLKDKQFVLRTDYKRTLEELLKAIAEEEICVLFYEHLLDEGKSALELKRFCSFLGVDFIAGDVHKKVNAGVSGKLPSDVHSAVADRFSSVYEYVFRTFNERVPQRWRENAPTGV